MLRRAKYRSDRGCHVRCTERVVNAVFKYFAVERFQRFNRSDRQIKHPGIRVRRPAPFHATSGLSNVTAGYILSSESQLKDAGNHIDLGEGAVLAKLIVSRYLTLVMFAVLSSRAMGQSPTCGAALSQLQNYVTQVNAFANVEYFRNIPARCGPNAYCQQTWLNRLNVWYQQQTALVNGWYQQIGLQCSPGSGPQPPTRVRSAPPSGEEPGRIDESSITDLQVDDEDKTVRIQIPDNPHGYR